MKEDTEKRRRRCSENLRDDLSDKLVHNKLRRIYILLPKDEDHQSTHPIDQDHQSTHPIGQDHQSTHPIGQVNIKLNQVSGTITTDGLAYEDDTDEERHCETVPVLDVDVPSVIGIPDSKLRALAIRCRDKLSVIQNATYVCQEESTMEHLYKLLDKAATYMSSTLQRDDDFIKTPEVKVKKRKRLIVI